jgi:DNA polymerase-1
MHVYVLDIEANGLRDEATEIHCIVVRGTKGESYEFIQPRKDNDEGVRFGRFLVDAYAEGASVAGHFAFGYDYRVIRRLLVDHPILREPATLRTLDTLVLSRMLCYKITGGHSIEAWGTRFGVKKVGVGISDWSILTDEMLSRCRSDVDINLRLIQKFMRFLDDPAWFEAFSTEMQIADVCTEMEQTGIPFNLPEALRLHTDLQGLLEPIDQIIARDFGVKAIPIKEVTPRVNRDGTLNRQDFRWYGSDDLSAFTGGPFTRFTYQEFNPSSHKQVVERLNEAGWRPTERTDGHSDAVKEGRVTDEHRKYGWKISEENLKTLPESAPEAARSLAKRIVIASRLSDLEEWIALCGEDGRLHPQFTSIGAWTQRLSHQRPNSANIPASKPSASDTEFDKSINDINARMRKLFHAPKGKRLVGTDADGIQMRIFAHVIEDQKLIEALVNGRKEDKSDIHSVHQRALGTPPCGSRDEAKTFIYAFLLGAGVGRVAEIFGCAARAAKKALGDFLDFYPGLKKLKRTLIPQWAERGYFVGLDGRKVPCDSEHLMLAGILQCGEKVIMARALLAWMKELRKRNIPFELVNWVHDEWQTLIDDDDDVCAQVQAVQVQAIRDQGPLLNMICPLEGSSSWGYNWQETH